MNLLEVNLEKLRSVLGTDIENGLTSEQVLRNRREFGENILFEKKKTFSDLVKKIFGDVMMILFLLVSLFDYLGNGNLSSLVSALMVAFLYALLVFGSHLYIGRVEAKIEKYSGLKYQVRRSGKIRSVSKRELVPGDILLLGKGDVMPCDGIILKHSALKILEASVTGRRVPVFKRSHQEVENEESGLPYFDCILFAGSVILHGNAKVFVCNTGTDIFDNENFTISRQNTTTPRIYQTAMELKKQIHLIWVVACFFLFSWSVFFGFGVFHSFHFASAVVIAAFPDAIEHLCDIAIAYMTSQLFKEGIVLRNPGAVDRLSDVNRVFVNSGEYLFYAHPIPNSFYLGEEFYSFADHSEKASVLLENILLAQSSSSYFSGKRDEINGEKAIQAAAAGLGMQKTRLEKKYLSINRYDFDPKYGYSCALVLCDGKYRLIIRGNPNSVLSACSEMIRDGESVPMNDANRSHIRANARHLAGICERMVAVAVLNLSSPSTGDQRKLCRGMTYLGIFGLSTPVSASAANAVNTCQKSGIKTYLLTDDYPETVAGLSKSVSIIGEGDYQYALSYDTYQRMDRGVFVADVEKYKAYCGFPVEEKQSIVKYHKDNGDITLSLTSGLYDTLPQMESDISIVGVEEKQNAVRMNADLLLKEKKYEIIPLCINWARIFYRNVVHIMQYILLVQVCLGISVLIGITAHGSEPFSLLPMLLAGLGVVIPCGANIFYRMPGPRLEDHNDVLKDDRVASLQVLVIIPMIIGIAHAISVMLSYQIALYASGGSDVASGAALLTFMAGSFFSSVSVKFDGSCFGRWKEIGKMGIATGLVSLLVWCFAVFSPFRTLWETGSVGSGYSFWIVFFAFLLSLVPVGITEWMKCLKRDDTAQERVS